MRALVLEGGAMRGIFTAGVLDAFAERHEPPFDLVVGVSAGACCGASYLAGQHGRNRRIFVRYMTTRAFADPLRMVRGGSLTDMDYIMGPVTYDLDPLDIGAVRGCSSIFEAVATEAVTGDPRYLPARGPDCVHALLATVALPFFYRSGPVSFRDEQLFDGGVADPIPLCRAIEAGATDITVVLTRPASWSPSQISPLEWGLLALDSKMQRYPGTFHAIRRRHTIYRRTHGLLGAPPAGVTLRIYRPPEGFPVERFTRKRSPLQRGYELGCLSGARAGEVIVGQ